MGDDDSTVGLLESRLQAVRGAVADACRVAERDPAEVTTIVVTKFHPMQLVRQLHALGVRDFGENRHQEARDKAKQAEKKPPLTQFGRAMQTLNVEIIAANSPQAKGRVERFNGTLQDRLVKELKLAGITTIAAANRFLETHYLKAFNDRFAVVPASGINAHQKLPVGVVLADVLCHQEPRTVGEDWCVRVQSRILQIDRRHAGLSLAGRKIQVLMPVEGNLKLMYQGQTLACKELAVRPIKLPEKSVAAPPRTPWKPDVNHAWRQSFVTRPGR